MKPTHSFIEKKSELASRPKKKNHTPTNSSSKVDGDGTRLIRFEEKKEIYSWVLPEEILFVKSADHYVKSLIQQGKKKKWVTRHCTLKDMLPLLACGHFIRLNKFYILNCDHFSYINENEKILYLNDGSPIPIPHRISRFIIDILNH